MAKILTQEWFDKVDELTNKAGDLNLPPAIKNMSINLQVTDSDNQEVNAAFYDGTIHQGLKDGALTTLKLDADPLKAIFFDRDMNREMEAFMSGKIRVEGDMGQLMSIQTASPSVEQKQLFKDILANTQV
jgi:putative sterol carrier protein